MLKYRDGLGFERRADGAVVVQAVIRDAAGGVVQIKEWSIGGAEWCNIVAGLSARGKVAKTAIKEIHG